MRNLIFAILILPMLSNAADWKVANYGTRSTCSAGADWTEANVHPTIASVANTCASSVATGDTITLAAGSYGSAVTCGASLNITGALTVRGATGNPDDVIIGADAAASAAAISLGCAAGNNDWVFEDLTITKTAIHTATALPLFMIQSETRNVTLNNVRIRGFTAVVPANNSSLSGLIVTRFNGARSSRTITLTDTTISDVDLTYENGAPFILWAPSGAAVVLNGENTIRDITYNSTGPDNTDGPQGGFYIQSGASLDINGPVNAANITSRVNPGNQNYGLFRVVHTATISLDGGNITCTDFVFEGGEPPAACVYTTGAFDMADGWVIGERITIEEDAGGNNNGAVFVTPASTGTGTAKVRCRDSSSKTGAALYAGDGGGGNFLVDSIGCSVDTGVVYSGGDGDITVRGVISKTKARAGKSQVSGRDVYVHVNSDTATRSKTARLYDLSIGETDDDESLPSVYVSNASATYSLTVDIANSHLPAGSGVSFTAQEGASAAVNVTARSVNSLGTFDTADIVNGSVSQSGETSVDPKFRDGLMPIVADGFRLRADSPLIRQGVCYLSTGCVYPDIGGRRARVPPDIGAWQRRAGD